MAAKGDRARLEPVARQMYIDQGVDLTAISEVLGVSRQTLSGWKADTRRPGDDLDEWDQARARKRSYEDGIRESRDQLAKKVREAALSPDGVPPPALVDSLAKLDAIVDRSEKRARETAEALAKIKGEMFLAVVRDLIDFGRREAPGLVVALEEVFDDLVEWGRGKYGA